MGPYRSLWVIIGSYECLCVLIDSNGSSWVFIVPFASIWILIGLYGSFQVLIRSYGFYWSLWVFIDPLRTNKDS